jgi:hypothetical protein
MTRKPSAVKKIESAMDQRVHPDTEAGPVGLGELYRRQREEGAEKTWGGVVPMTAGQGKGAIFGIVVGAVIGAALFWPFGFISWGTDVSLGLRILTAAIIGAIAGSTAGVLYFGGRVPELDGETLSADGLPGTGTSPADPRTDERGRPTSGRDHAPTRSDDPATGAAPGSRRRGSP